MKRNVLILLVVMMIGLQSCNREQPNQFSEEAKSSVCYDLEGNKTTFGAILEENKGKLLVIDLWASWCGDCLRGLPELIGLHKEINSEEVVFLMLSVDEKEKSWKAAVDRFKIPGKHYIQEGDWDSVLNGFLRMNEIPHYVVVGKSGNISVFKTNQLPKEIILSQLGK